ncbi:MAG: hypothetical protein J6Q73_01755, partial [Bacteroidaceae bacterium]|nr:hypothetical protein [Bacteroidaceae bacterium]
YNHLKPDVLNIVAGNYVSKRVMRDKRNRVELVSMQGCELVVKRYKRPNLFNRFAYTFLRKSKARRAYEYAFRLLSMGVDTPVPVAYVEVSKKGLFIDGFFVSVYMPYGLISDAYTGVVPDSEKARLTKEFMDFTLSLHEKKILPMDFNSSNIFYFFDEKEGKYRFALTDINRMRFGKTPSTSAVMRSFEQFGVPVEGLYKLAVYYCSRKGADVEYSIFIFLFHRMVRRIKRALKLKAKEALHIL